MQCILRIYGEKLDIDDLTRSIKLVPYRKDAGDDPKINCLYYDMFSAIDGNFNEQVLRIEEFITSHHRDLQVIMRRKDVEGAQIDLLLPVYDEVYLMNLEINTKFMRILVKYNLSLTLSMVKSSD
jgi:hypothetical protein